MEKEPKCELSVDQSLPELERNAQVKIVCKKLVEGWSDLDASMFDVKVVSGGITNTLLQVVRKDHDKESVVVRINGSSTDLFIDRSREIKARHDLFKAGFGANLIGVYANGIVESFIDGRNLLPEELSKPDIAALIAKEVRRFHNVDVDVSEKEPQLWNDITKFLNQASDGPEYSVEFLRKEVESLKALSDRLNSPVVFAHNDLLSGNMMLENGTGKLYLIDFEYGSYSYRGFDIGNHFNEYAGFNCDYTLYPSKEQQYHFFRHYLYSDDPMKASEMELYELDVETNFYALASHLYWGAWALVQSKSSTIDFDYLGYHSARLKEYLNRKNQIMRITSSYLKHVCNLELQV